MTLKSYETVFVLTPVLSEEDTQAVVSKFRAFLQERNAEIVHEQKLGVKRLAYPIQQKSTGMYQLFEFRASPDFIHALATEYRREEKVLRFMTLALDKHAIDYNAQKRAGITADSTQAKQKKHDTGK